MTTTINHSDDTRQHAGGMEDTTDPDPEVPERARGPGGSLPPTRRGSWPSTTRSAKPRRELLRREGLYSSLLTEWRRQRDRGAEERWPGRPAASQPILGTGRSPG